jgi:hypothetical protein
VGIIRAKCTRRLKVEDEYRWVVDFGEGDEMVGMIAGEFVRRWNY